MLRLLSGFFVFLFISLLHSKVEALPKDWKVQYCKQLEKDFIYKIPVDLNECLKDIDKYMKKYMELQQKKRDEERQSDLKGKPKEVSIKDNLLCSNAVKQASKFPNKTNVHYLLDRSYYVIKREGKWRIIIKGGADLMNSLGNMIPHRYHCEITKGKITFFEIYPG